MPRISYFSQRSMLRGKRNLCYESIQLERKFLIIKKKKQEEVLMNNSELSVGFNNGQIKP